MLKSKVILCCFKFIILFHSSFIWAKGWNIEEKNLIKKTFDKDKKSITQINQIKKEWEKNGASLDALSAISLFRQLSLCYDFQKLDIIKYAPQYFVGITPDYLITLDSDNLLKDAFSLKKIWGELSPTLALGNLQYVRKYVRTFDGILELQKILQNQSQSLQMSTLKYLIHKGYRNDDFKNLSHLLDTLHTGDDLSGFIKLYDVFRKRNSPVNFEEIASFMKNLRSENQKNISKMIKTLASFNISKDDNWNTVVEKTGIRETLFNTMDSTGKTLFDYKHYDSVYPSSLIKKSFEEVNSLLQNDPLNFKSHFENRFEKTIYKNIFDCDDDKTLVVLGETRPSCLQRVDHIMDSLNPMDNNKQFSCFIVSGTENDWNGALTNKLTSANLLKTHFVKYNNYYCKRFNTFDELRDFIFLSDSLGFPKRKILLFVLAHGGKDSIDTNSTYDEKRKYTIRRDFSNYFPNYDDAKTHKHFLDVLLEVQDAGHQLGLIVNSCYSAELLTQKMAQDAFFESDSENFANLSNRLRNFCLIVGGGRNDKGNSTVSTNSLDPIISGTQSIQGKNLIDIYKMSKRNQFFKGESKRALLDEPLASYFPWNSFNSKKMTTNNFAKMMRETEINSSELSNELDKARFEGCRSFTFP